MYCCNIHLSHLKDVDYIAIYVIPEVNIYELIANWDTAMVDLHRNGGTFLAYDVRLRKCSLHYNETCNEYYIKYRDVTFGASDIYNMRKTEDRNNGLFPCPFCGEHGFDKEGLKYHLNKYCEGYENTK